MVRYEVPKVGKDAFVWWMVGEKMLKSVDGDDLCSNVMLVCETILRWR